MRVTLWMMVRRSVRAAMYGVGRSFVALGAVWIEPAMPHDAPPGPGGPPDEPGGPPTGHPERLCPEIPLSPVELALSRQLGTVRRVGL